MKKLTAILLSVILLLSFAACGKTDNGGTAPNDTNELEKITVCLDWTPNTNHTGLFVALAKGFYKDAGLDVTIIQPPENGAVQACSAGQAQFAVDFQDTLAPAFTSDTPMDVTAVAALIQHNTSGIISKKGEGMDRPAGIEGKEYLTWDNPTELAIMKKVVTDDGGDWSKVKIIPNTVTDEAQDITANPSHAIWVFYAWSGINAQVSGVDTDFFYLKDIDPTFDYYTPVLVANNGYLASNPEQVKAFLNATQAGYEYAIENPEDAARILIDSDETGSLTGSEELVEASQLWLADKYTDDAFQWGYIDAARWNAFYAWLYSEGLIEKEIPENFGFTNEFLS
ncbi:MAG: ABC transporter substrate-binding protein [Clostridia bacterium]|nr:ABC transporter substrate-binding protein [Clostridia bacterium]